jgi:hypothetical protein
MPSAREVPALEALITEDAPSPLNPLGLKGAGEGVSTRPEPQSLRRLTTPSACPAQSRSCR